MTNASAEERFGVVWAETSLMLIVNHRNKTRGKPLGNLRHWFYCAWIGATGPNPFSKVGKAYSNRIKEAAK